MGSRNVDLYITKAEWCRVLQELRSKQALYGVLHLWPDHRYEVLDFDRLEEQTSPDDASTIAFRGTPLDPNVPIREYADAPPRHGMVLAEVPRVFNGGRLICCNAGIRAEDAILTGSPDPTPLFNSFKRLLLRGTKKGVKLPDSGKIDARAGYTDGALQLWENGIELWPFPQVCGPVTPMPDRGFEAR